MRFNASGRATLECRTQWQPPRAERERGLGLSLLGQDVYRIYRIAISQGATGDLVSPQIPASSPGYSLTIQQVGWGHAGGAALRVWLDASYDDGGSWENLTEDTLPDEPQPAGRNYPANAFRVAAGIEPERGRVSRRLRLRYEAIKAVTVSGTIASLTVSQ